MKTKEFIERLSALGYSTTKYLDTIEVLEMVTPKHGRIYGRIHRKEPYRIETTQYTRQDPRVFDLMVEYARTPLDEREEEKKYRLELFDNHTSKLTLLETYSRQFSMSGLTQWIFTQSEIDNFPPEIKGAIECGFLKKVEVEE